MPSTQEQKLWEQEWRDPTLFPQIQGENPSRAVSEFVEFLKARGFDPEHTKVLDLGCGAGRNALYLADQGFVVSGVEHSDEALKKARARAKSPNNPTFYRMNMARKDWILLQASYEAAIDCNGTINIQNPGRQNAIRQARRILISGGYYLFYGVARTQWCDLVPGPEPNSTWHQLQDGNQIFEKQYTKDELLEAYSDFKLVDYKLTPPNTSVINGRETEFSLHVAIFQRP